ncbi:MAG: hypothetical protein AB8B85_22550 [Paracoccaceae bacterium]
MNIRLVGGVIAVALIACGYMLKDQHYNVPSPPPDFSPLGVDTQLQSEPVEVFRIVKTGFPQEYEKLTEELSAALQADSDQVEVARITQNALTELRRTHADAVLAAPQKRLREIIDMSRDLHASVREGAGRVACNRFAVAGPGSLGPALSDYRESLDLQASALLKAIVEGRASGSTPLQPTTAEGWTAARQLALSMGANRAHMDALVSLDQENGDLCAGLVSLLQAFAAMDDSLGQRLRASYVRDLARN